MQRSTTTWLLFAALTATVPVRYFFFVVTGYVPLLLIFFWWLQHGFSRVDGLHVLVYGPLLYLLAAVLAAAIAKLPRRVRVAAALALVLACAALGFARVYCAPAHGRPHFENVYELYEWELSWQPG